MNLERSIRNLERSRGRVVTLAFLAKLLPAEFLGEQVARSLSAETGATVALVRLSLKGGPPAARAAASALKRNGHSFLPAPAQRIDGGVHFLDLDIAGESPSRRWINGILEQLRRRFHYVLIEAVTDELPAPVLFEFLLQSDLAYLFVKASSDDVYHLALLVRELRPRLENHAVELKPVLCLGDGEEVDGYESLIQNVAGPLEIFIRGLPKGADTDVHPTGSFSADVRRLARQIGSCLVGLALSSGAAKGLSHIGVIQVLEENGIEVDVVAGSSMGAYVGAAWCYGFDGQKLEQLARELESPWAFMTLIDPAFPPRQGFVRGKAVKRRLMRSIGHVHFTELVRPLRVTATNLETLECVAFCSGEVATAVHASIAVPGICVPVTIDGETYIDGGIVDPLPVDILREMGVSRIIAVNAIPTPDRIRYCLQAEHELAQLSKKRVRQIVNEIFPLGERLNYFARGNILEILMRSIHGGQIRMAETLCQQADLVLRPEICDDRWMDFREPGRFITPGRQIAERYLDEIKALVSRKVVKNDPVIEPVAAIA